MIFTFLVTFLLTIALAAPSHIESRISQRQSRPVQRIKANSVGNNTRNVAYSNNWSGVVLAGYPSGTFVAVTGTIVVPSPGAPDGSVSAWVGIDGDTCVGAILQTGIYITFVGGAASFEAWYEWYPGYASNFNGISISAGNSIQLTVNVFSSTTGSATIENLSTGQRATQDLSSSTPLCQQDAEWIVEDYSENGSLVPMCNFDKVEFTDAYATTASGTRIYPPSGVVFEINQGGKVYTSVSVGSESVSVSYQ